MALGIMLVLALTLAAVIFLTSSSARDAHRSNASQKAYDLAEAGINNALAVLNANYPTANWPGDFSLFSGSGAGEANCGTWPNGCTSTYASGTANWTGTLRSTAPGTAWTYEWSLQSRGTVKNPTGPTSDVTRVATAIVPVVVPDTNSVDPNHSSIDWVYGLLDVTFSQSVTVASPVSAGRNIILQNTATIAETIPATPGNPAQPNRIVATNDLIQGNTGMSQNHVGHVNGTVDPPTTPNNDMGEVHIGNKCIVQNVGGGSEHTCVFGTTATPGTDYLFVGNTVCPAPPAVSTSSCHDNVTTGIVDTPSFTCCTGIGDPNRQILGAGGPVDTTHPGTGPGGLSDMGFWYQTADLGPYAPCKTYNSTGSIAVPLRFDMQGAAPTAVGADKYIDQSATAGIAPFDLTPPNAGYECIAANGAQLSWNGTNSQWITPTGQKIPANTLWITAKVFIDGSATSSANPATYVGKGAIFLSGTFRMTNHEELCVHVSGTNCDTSATWDPNVAGLFIFAAGNFGTELSTQNTNTLAGESIDMKQAQYQGGLFGLRDVVGDVSGTVLVGPIVSAYGNVAAGQSGVLSFPPIQFPSSGTDGFTGPFPNAHLLAPRQFGGS